MGSRFTDFVQREPFVIGRPTLNETPKLAVAGVGDRVGFVQKQTQNVYMKAISHDFTGSRRPRLDGLKPNSRTLRVDFGERKVAQSMSQ